MSNRITAFEIILLIALFIYLILMPLWQFSSESFKQIWTTLKRWFGIIKQINPEDIIKNPEEVSKTTIPDEITSVDYSEHNDSNKDEEPHLSSKTVEKIATLKEQAQSAKEKGNSEEAEKYLIEARGLLEGQSDNDIDKMLAEIYFDQGQYVKASSLIKKIISEDESQHKATRQMGYIHVIQGDFDTARLFLEKAIQLKDDNPKYYITLVDILYQQELWEEAITHLEKVQKLRPSNIDYLVSLGQLNEKTNNFPKAEYRYTKVIELDPHHSLAKQKLS